MLSLALFKVTDARPVSQLSDALETLCDAEAMSALPLKADIRGRNRNVR
jgi:hypothetical protein